MKFFAGPLLLLAVAGCGDGRTNRDGGTGAGRDLVFPAGDPPDLLPPCEGLQCQQANCGELEPTTLTGRVFAPEGTLPLYNAIVYVPLAELEPFTPGVSCDKCGALASGRPLVTALTDEKGEFKLNNVPAGDNIPLVLQIGRWRRKVTIPRIEPCVENRLDPVKHVNLQRLPRNKSEGDIPKMAIASGSADPFECLLRKIGLDDKEFTLMNDKGRVHFFRENGRDMVTPAPPGSMLYGSLSTLKKYDLVMLPCEGSERKKPAEATQNLIDYTNAGGRVFTTHYGYVWIHFAQPPWPMTGDFMPGQPLFGSPFPGKVDMSFPKGKAFSKWLVNVGASQNLGELAINEARYDLKRANKPAQRWVYGTTAVGGAQMDVVQNYTFNTPLYPKPPDGGGDPVQCGRVVFSDFHVSAMALSGQKNFPDSCKNEKLSAQEKALAFMLFDLSACVQKDEEPPMPPIP